MSCFLIFCTTTTGKCGPRDHGPQTGNMPLPRVTILHCLTQDIISPADAKCNPFKKVKECTVLFSYLRVASQGIRLQAGEDSPLLGVGSPRPAEGSRPPRLGVGTPRPGEGSPPQLGEGTPRPGEGTCPAGAGSLQLVVVGIRGSSWFLKSGVGRLEHEGIRLRNHMESCLLL